jgi:hypothetical protein
LSQVVEANFKTFRAGAAIGKYLRVKLTAGKLAVAVAADREWLGTLEAPSFEDGDVRRIRLRTAVGTMRMIANGVINQGAGCWTAAAGKVSASPGTGATYVGICIEPAAADGDVIEVLHIGGESIQP